MSFEVKKSDDIQSSLKCKKVEDSLQDFKITQDDNDESDVTMLADNLENDTRETNETGDQRRDVNNCIEIIIKTETEM